MRPPVPGGTGAPGALSGPRPWQSSYASAEPHQHSSFPPGLANGTDICQRLRPGAVVAVGWDTGHVPPRRQGGYRHPVPH